MLSSGLNVIRRPERVKSGSKQSTLAGKDLLRQRRQCCNPNFVICNIKANPYPNAQTLTIEFLPGCAVWRVFGKIVQQGVQVFNFEAAELLLLIVLPTAAEQNHIGLQGVTHL